MGTSNTTTNQIRKYNNRSTTETDLDETDDATNTVPKNRSDLAQSTNPNNNY